MEVNGVAIKTDKLVKAEALLEFAADDEEIAECAELELLDEVEEEAEVVEEELEAADAEAADEAEGDGEVNEGVDGDKEAEDDDPSAAADLSVFNEFDTTLAMLWKIEGGLFRGPALAKRFDELGVEELSEASKEEENALVELEFKDAAEAKKLEWDKLEEVEDEVIGANIKGCCGPLLCDEERDKAAAAESNAFEKDLPFPLTTK